jgi:hypothetical protein
VSPVRSVDTSHAVVRPQGRQVHSTAEALVNKTGVRNGALRVSQASGEHPKWQAAGTDRLAASYGAPLSRATGGVIEGRPRTRRRHRSPDTKVQKNVPPRRLGDGQAVKIGTDFGSGLHDPCSKSRRTARTATPPPSLEVARSATKNSKKGSLGGITTPASTKTNGPASQDPFTACATKAGAPSTVGRAQSLRRWPNGCRYVEKMIRRTAFCTRSSSESALLGLEHHIGCSQHRAFPKT